MTPDERFAELQAMLAPAGGGVHLVSTGKAEARDLQRQLYGVERDEQIREGWHAAIRRLPQARVAILGVPSDTGAGLLRGANRAPAVVRQTLLEELDHPYHNPAVVDVGDVRVIPHLLSEEMLSGEQIQRSRESLYEAPATPLPVSPLAITARAVRHLTWLNPDVVPVVIGGDHSVAWPAFSAIFRHAEAEGHHKVGLLHIDAHTDLLDERLGVKYCFSTWAYHANELLGRDGRLVQVGIRASVRAKEHWESTLNVRQYWPDEVDRRHVVDIGDEIVGRFRRLGCDVVYVSNDIDGTDIRWAAATGTPEPGGLTPDFVRALVQHVTSRLPMIAGDLVEVAPPLTAGRNGEPATTLATARGYLADLIRAGLAGR